MLKSFANLMELFRAFPDEQSAIDHLTSIRWANGKFCPLCGNLDEARIGTLKGTNTHKCYACRQRFSIKVGTIFQDTKLPLRTWFAAIWMLTNHPKGIASTTLATNLGITQKSAWFVLHRLRYAAKTKSFNAPLKGEVAVDETAIGGLEKNKHASKRKHLGTGSVGKTIVMGLVEKGGEVRAGVIDDVSGKTLKVVVRTHVQPGAVVVTDQWAGYGGLKADYDHKTVNHGAGEYVVDGFTTNAIESVWALLNLSQAAGFEEFVKLVFLKLLSDRRVRDRFGPLIDQSCFDVPKDAVIFSTSWIEAREEETPNPLDAVQFRQLLTNLENEIRNNKKKRIFRENSRISLHSGTVKEVVRRLEHVYLFGIDADLNGRLFKTFLSATMRGKDLGQFFTPRSVAKLGTMLADPKADGSRFDVVLDGCCGTGGFLIDVLAEMWAKVNANPTLSESEKVALRKRVAEEAIYGVDIAQEPKVAAHMRGSGDGKHTTLSDHMPSKRPVRLADDENLSALVSQTACDSHA